MTNKYIHNILVQSTTQNKKTGDIPTIIVGTDYNKIVESCKTSECALLHKSLGGKGTYKELGLKPCYAHKGSVGWGTKSILKALQKGTKTIADYSLKEGFRLSARTAKYFRLSAIGDASSLPIETIKAIIKEGKEYGLLPLGYTASLKAEHLKEICIKSCTSMNEADKAVKAGWRATTIFHNWNGERTFTTPDGNVGVVCPEQTQAIKDPNVSPRKKITCNTCGLCSQGNQHPTRYKVIGFLSH